MAGDDAHGGGVLVGVDAILEGLDFLVVSGDDLGRSRLVGEVGGNRRVVAVKNWDGDDASQCLFSESGTCMR